MELNISIDLYEGWRGMGQMVRVSAKLCKVLSSKPGNSILSNHALSMMAESPYIHLDNEEKHSNEC
jgi:hypothetical protein